MEDTKKREAWLQAKESNQYIFAYKFTTLPKNWARNKNDR